MQKLQKIDLASSHIVLDKRRSNISLKETKMPRKSGRRKAIFAKSIDVAHDVEGQSEVVK